MPEVDRRAFLKSLIAAAAIGGGLAGYWNVIDDIIKPKWLNVSPDLQNGKNVRYVYTSCLGCNVRCGLRVRVIQEDGVDVVERIEGNPYHPYNRAVSFETQMKRYAPLPYTYPIKEATEKWHGTLCPRGQDGIHYLYDPYRIIKPLKRAGPRGSGKWKTITWEQLINEIVNGGMIEETGEKLPGLKEFFVYGKLKEVGYEDPNIILASIKKDVDNLMKLAKDPATSYDDLLKALESFKSKWSEELGKKGLKLEDILINPDRPDLGPKSNMVVFQRGRGQDNADLFSLRWINAFGSINWLRHTSACQLGFYTGNYLWAGYSDLQADLMSAKVVIMAGASMGRLHPGATGQGAMIERATNGELKIYYINPVAPRTEARNNIIWVPIKPGTDAALALAIIRWIIENNQYNKEFLSIPNLNSANTKGYPVNTNATWLVIFEGSRFGEFLKASDIGLENSNKPVVMTKEGLSVYDKVDSAELDYDGIVKLVDGSNVRVRTPFNILKEESMKKSLEEWSSECGVPTNIIIQIAKDFVNAAPMAATYIHRGVAMHPNGEYSVWAYRMLDTLIGNFHIKGGMLGRASTTSYSNYVYNISASGFNEPIRWGPPIDRHKYAYEDTLEYWLKIKKKENPYPAERPWYVYPPEEIYTELFAGIFYGYPYKIGALILYYANPVLAANYGIKFIETLKDTNKLPLYIAITTTINETMLYADYIIPDTTYLETGTNGIQYLYASSMGVAFAEAWRTPVIMPLTQYIGTCPNGHDRYASMWEFLIDTAKSLRMPGYGDNAIPGTKGKKYEGKWFSLHCVWEYNLRSFANAALDAKDKNLIPSEIPLEDVDFVEKNYPIARFKSIVPEDEWKYITYGLARGGIFVSYENSFNEKGISKRPVPGSKTLMLWNDGLAKTKNSITGQKFWGGPTYLLPATYAPVKQIIGKVDSRIPGTPIRELYPEDKYPMLLVFQSGPLYTKHRSQFYYWIKIVAPENFAIIHPNDASKLGIETGDIITVETPEGIIEVPAVVESTVMPGVIMIPYGMGRWADTLVVKPNYFEPKDLSLKNIIETIPGKTEIPDDAVNPVKDLPVIVKRILFTKSPAEYYEKGLYVDKWRFNGVTPNVIEASDPSLNGWPLLSWIGGSQSYYFNVARISKTGRKHVFEIPNIIY